MQTVKNDKLSNDEKMDMIKQMEGEFLVLKVVPRSIKF